MIRLWKWLLFFGIVAAIVLISAEKSASQARQADTSCSDLAQQAMEAALAQCAETGRNQVCYGHINLDAQPQPDVSEFKFDAEGDRVRVTDLQSLRLSSVDLVQDAWGIALLKLQASLPDSSDQNVTLIMFGNVQVENAARSVPLAAVTVDTSRYLNIRSAPSLDADILGAVAPGESLTATGRLADGSWLRVEVPDSAATGWVFADFVSGSGTAALDVVDFAEPYYSPMQAFYFQSGAISDVCQEAPNGLLVQTPEGVGRVTFLINEVNVQFGSTLFFRSEPGRQMSIDVLEGSAIVTAFGKTVQLAQGSGLDIPITGDLRASGVPGDPRPYRLDTVQFVPLDLLPLEIEIAPPVDETVLAAEPPVVVPSPVPTDPPEPTATPVPPPTATNGPDRPRPTAVPTDTPTPVPTDTPTPTDTDTPVPTDTPAPTDTYTPVPTDTPTSTPTEGCAPPGDYRPLHLESLCSPDPDSYRVWSVTNANFESIDFTWAVHGSGQSGGGTVGAATCSGSTSTTFTTAAEAGSNTVSIFVSGVRQDTAPSHGGTCP